MALGSAGRSGAQPFIASGYRHRRSISVQLTRLALLFPILLFLLIVFLIPALRLLSFSVLTQNVQGIVGAPLTFAHFRKFFTVGLYTHVLWTTLKVSLLTSLITASLAYPAALKIASSRPFVARIFSLVLITPLVVSVVVRSYGWRLILLRGPRGALNSLLMSVGLLSRPLEILYTSSAVVIGQVHISLPIMVLPLVAAIGKIDPNLRDAAETLGASRWQVFLRVTLPLSLPGLVAGVVMVFSLTAGAFVTPVILGGPSTLMLGNLIQQQIFTIFDWPFGATISCVLITIVLSMNALLMRIVEARVFRRGSK